MSADNGIYILETLESEYRVAHLQAIDNLYWDNKIKNGTQDINIHINNARKMFKNCYCFKSQTIALIEAQKLYNNLPIVEYGIQTIKIPLKF